MPWRKNPSDLQWEKATTTTTGGSASAPGAAPSSEVVAVAHSHPHDDTATSQLNSTIASSLSFDHDNNHENPPDNDNDNDHNNNHGDTHTWVSETNNSNSVMTNQSQQSTAAYVKEVLSDTLQILQGVPPPTRNPQSTTTTTATTAANNADGDTIPDHFIMTTSPRSPPLHDDEPEIVYPSIHPPQNNTRSSQDEEEEDEQPIDFLQDDVHSMTLGRRIALSLINYKWYNPSIAIHQTNEATATAKTTTTTANDLVLSNHSHENKNPLVHSSTPSPPRPLSRPSEPPAVTALEYPSLAKAWAYFEHVTLPRYFLPDRDPNKRRKSIVVRAFRRVFCKGRQALDRAEPGEDSAPTLLYHPLFTPLAQMGDFGLGIGLYFSTLRAMMILTFLAGIINIPNLKYFSGPYYTDGTPQTNTGGLSKLLQGSAICPTDSQMWVPCIDCNNTSSKYLPNSRLAYANVTTYTLLNTTNTTTNTTTTLLQQDRLVNVTFALRNFCHGATLQQGMVNYGTLWFFLLGILWLNHYLQRQEVKFDEDEQTAQDYSMVITNPPSDATDPDEWKRFLETAFAAEHNVHVTVCTVAVDNDLLVRSLVERREKMKRIEMSVEPGTKLDDISLSNIAARTERERTWYQHLIAHYIVPGIPEWFGRVVVLNAKVQGLAQQEYPASNVFVSFETEAAQRHVLSTLSVGALQAKRNDGRVLSDPKYLFRGVHVLQVEEAEEPNTIRWQDLNSPWLERSKELFWTTVATLVAIALIAFIVQLVNATSTVFAAFMISIFNAVFPMFAKILTRLESHPAEGQKQTSLYFKIALFRWVNTAIVYTIIRPFTSTLDSSSGGIIPSVYAQFFAEIVTSNALQLLDPVGHLQRHVLAPRAKSQDAMNLNMQGAAFELAERYTNMTKLLFLAMWYCAIYPAAFFMCSFALLVNYFVDRFSLFRTWKPAPHLGTSISRFSRNYFFSLAVVAMAVVSSYYWSAFPFDNLCPTLELPHGGASPYHNNNNHTFYDYQVTSLVQRDHENNNNLFFNTTATTTTTHHPINLEFEYRFCLQDLIRTHPRPKIFPFTARSQPRDNRWMTHDQELVTNVYGWTSVAVMGIVVLSFLYRWWQSVQGLFQSTYSPCGEDQGIHFSDVPSMNTYIPQVQSPVFGYPLLATNITGLDTSLLEWTDPDREFEFYDLTKDAERLLRGTDISSKVVFSQVKHWPPPRRTKKQSSRRKSSSSNMGNNSSHHSNSTNNNNK